MKKIIISGEIGWDVMPSDVRSQLNSAGGADLDIYIASPGGYVSDGLEIYNMIRDYKRDNPNSQIMATLKGVAASMATYLAVNPAIDLVAAEDNAVFMIHNVWGYSSGDYRDMKKSAEVFEGLTNIIAKSYQKKTKEKFDKIRDMMDDETWLFGEEIQEMGFVDEIIKTDEDKDKKSSIASARMKFSSLSEKMQKKPENDYLKIAASIKPDENGDEKKYTSINQIRNDFFAENNNVRTPAKNAGNNNTEEISMETLEELMAKNPAAKIQFEEAMKNKFEAGVTQGKETMQKSITQASTYLGAESAYPSAIQSVAIQVLKGEKTIETLETTVSAFDAFKESQNSGNAQDETDGQAAAAGEQTPPASEDGVIHNAIDFQADIARTKASLGQEVQ